MNLVDGTPINITDIRKLRVVRIKETNNNVEHLGETVTELVFTYENTRYKLVKYINNIDEMQYSVMEVYMYNRINNKYELISKGSIYDYNVELYTDISSNIPKHPTYSNIDKRQLIVKLTYWGFVQGKYTSAIKTFKEQQKEIKSRIEELKQQVDTLEKNEKKLVDNLLKTTGKGSKFIDKEFKIKISNRNLDKALKKGDYVEEYGACIGDVHPSYGGELTDLAGLPYGTVFEVTNGAWYGIITYDDHADKAVQVVETGNIITITDKYRYLYLRDICSNEEQYGWQ